jgi:16S rRNA (guanine527-N7)-methyltransferase
MAAGAPDALLAGAAQLGVGLDEAAIERLERYVALLALWNRRVRLTAEKEPQVIVAKHVVDCLAPVPHLPPRGPIVDIGSGAGLPGIVLACLRPDLRVMLVESRRRRISFLREAIRAIPLPCAEALEMRAEEAAAAGKPSGRASMVVGRAIRLDVFLDLAAPFLAPGGIALSMQTPRTARDAESTAKRRGFRIARTEAYRLPGGEPRCLLLCTMFPGTHGAVS